MTIKKEIFKAYDIRGLYPSQIDKESAAIVAKAAGFYLKAKKMVIGMDARPSSPELHKAATEALTESGIDVYDMGLCPTPLLNYAVAKKGYDAGIMISASHNPAEYNGMKLIKKPCIQLSSPGPMDQIKKLSVATEGFENPPAKGEKHKLDIMNEYVEELCKKFDDIKGIKAVVDYGNGMGSLTARPVFKKIKLDVIELYPEPDCSFPNHPANPAEEENLEELKKRIVQEKADIGIAFDGDADRCYVLDNNGEVVYPDILAAMLIPHELKGRSEKRVYYDLRFSRIVEDTLKEHGGEGVMMRVGNPYYKKNLSEQGGVFAAELSGHFMFKDHYCIDDGLYAALKIMQVLSSSGKKLSEIAEPLKKYWQSPELNMKVEDPDQVMKKVSSMFVHGKSIDIDGVYIYYPDWWFNLRKSNTEPVVRLRLEADTESKLNSMKDKLLNAIKSN